MGSWLHSGMDLGGITVLLDQHGSPGGTSLGHQHGYRWWPSLHVSTASSLVTRTMDITIQHSCIRAIDLDMALGGSLGTDITMASGGRQLPHISSSLPSTLQFCLFPQHIIPLHSFAIFPIFLPYTYSPRWHPAWGEFITVLLTPWPHDAGWLLRCIF